MVSCKKEFEDRSIEFYYLLFAITICSTFIDLKICVTKIYDFFFCLVNKSVRLLTK